jgi:hypothetical protein
MARILRKGKRRRHADLSPMQVRIRAYGSIIDIGGVGQPLHIDIGGIKTDWAQVGEDLATVQHVVYDLVKDELGKHLLVLAHDNEFSHTDLSADNLKIDHEPASVIFVDQDSPIPSEKNPHAWALPVPYHRPVYGPLPATYEELTAGLA